MNKIKQTLMTFAVLVSIGSALAFRPHDAKKFDSLFWWNGTVYVQVTGRMGVDYACEGEANVCTYLFNSSTQIYSPYNTGTYTPAQ